MAEKRKLSSVIKKTHHNLTAAQRQAMPASEFALPGKGEGPKGAGAGAYPIPDKAHGRDALSRAAANGTSEEQAKVRQAVAGKFPGIGQKLYGKRRVARPGGE